MIWKGNCMNFIARTSCCAVIFLDKVIKHILQNHRQPKDRRQRANIQSTVESLRNKFILISVHLIIVPLQNAKTADRWESEK